MTNLETYKPNRAVIVADQDSITLLQGCNSRSNQRREQINTNRGRHRLRQTDRERVRSVQTYRKVQTKAYRKIQTRAQRKRSRSCREKIRHIS